ncbi:MAG: hypothetical protein KJO52_07995 [Maribacter sp.]|nr:hypothetical protein [Maribacter sp.]NNK18519.1 hypothetical protein [Maribacter sp.]
MIPKDFNQFLESLRSDDPPNEWPLVLKALWFDAKGNWKASHDIAQDMHDGMGSWIHAYLHRKEGDEFNAGYWYRNAKKPFPDTTLGQEFEQIVEFAILDIQLKQ